MKINLTKLLYIENRIIRINDDKGTTGDTSYTPPDTGTAERGTYSFELEKTADSFLGS